MNTNTLIILIWFELKQNIIRLKGLLFLIPYFLFWYLIFASLSEDVTAWLRAQEGIALSSWLFDYRTATNLFQNNPTSVSVYYILSLSTLPGFIFLGANNQLSSDTRSGAFRFLLTRVTRQEIYLSRIISTFILIAVAIVITSLFAALISFQNNEGDAISIINYTVLTSVVLLFYSLPFIAYMATISSITLTALGCLFLGFTVYCLMLIIILTYQTELFFLPFLLPSGIKFILYSIDINSLFPVLTLCIFYTLIYASSGWLIFKKRNL